MTDHTHDTESGISASLETDSLITIKEIREIFGLGRTAAYELTHRPGFPAPVPISRRCYRWWAKEVTAFAAELRAQPAITPKISHRQKETDRTPHSRDAQSLQITGEVRIVRSRKEKPGPLRETPSE